MGNSDTKVDSSSSQHWLGAVVLESVDQSLSIFDDSDGGKLPSRALSSTCSFAVNWIGGLGSDTMDLGGCKSDEATVEGRAVEREDEKVAGPVSIRSISDIMTAPALGKGVVTNAVEDGGSKN